MVVALSPDFKKEVLVCYDLQLSKAHVAEHLRTLFEAVKTQGFRIASVDFSPNLKYGDETVSNELKNKLLLTLEKATADNQEPSPEVIEAFKEFFSWKIVPDAIVKEMREMSDV